MSRYTVIAWDNNGVRTEQDVGNDFQRALILAKQCRTLDNRTVKIGMAGNALNHWSRSVHLSRNHWSVRVTADEFFV